MSKEPKRWIQWFEKYCEALKKLKDNVEDATTREFSDLEKMGIVKNFEMVQELAWQTLKDFFESIGENRTLGRKDVFKLAFQRGILPDDTLIRSTDSRNYSVHSYDNEEVADRVFYEIKDEYYHAFEQLKDALLKEKKNRGL